MVKKVRKSFKKKKQNTNTRNTKPKGKPPQALRKAVKHKVKARAPRAVAPPPRDVGLLDAISEALSDIEDLAGEMRDWSSSMEEKFSATDKYARVTECAETLEEVQDPVTDSMAFLNEIKISIQDPTPRRSARSRATRLGDVTCILNDVIDKLTAYDDDTIPEDRSAAAGELKDALEEIDSNMQGVEFPGMFG